MHHTKTSRSRAAGAVLSLLILMAVALSACGSSSSQSASAAASTTAKTSTGPASPSQLAARFTALRECLEKNGITLPKTPAGQRPRGFLGGTLGVPGGFHLPNGVSKAQYEAVLKKCGAGAPLRGGTRGFGRLRSPAFQAALKRFAACMRANGVNVPEPNTSGSGPIFGTNGLRTTSPQFRAAEVKCASMLRATLRAVPGKAGTSTG